MVDGIEKVKAESRSDLRAHAEAALRRLRAVDEDSWRALTGLS